MAAPFADWISKAPLRLADAAPAFLAGALAWTADHAWPLYVVFLGKAVPWLLRAVDESLRWLIRIRATWRRLRRGSS